MIVVGDRVLGDMNMMRKKFEKEIYYKTCHKNKKHGYVSISHPFSGTDLFCLRYKLNKVTKTVPGSLGLFVFDSLESVYKFSGSTMLNYNNVVLRCYVKGPVNPVNALWYLFREHLAAYLLDLRRQSGWSRKRRLEHVKRIRISCMKRTFQAPANTFSVAAVKPFEVISYEELTACMVRCNREPGRVDVPEGEGN